MKKSVKKNYIYNLIYQLLTIALPIITTPYLARTLGAGGVGVYGYTISIATYFVLFGSIGISLYGQREIAYVQNDKEKRNKLFSELVILKLITMTLSLVLFYFIFAQSGQYHTYYKLLILEVIASMIDISWLYQGLEEFKKIVLRNTIIKITSLIAIFTFIKDSSDTWIYVLIYSSSSLLANILLWVNVKKYVKFSFKNMNLKKHIKPTLSLFIPQIAIQVYTILDKTMIGAILHDMNEVGYYEQAEKVVKILLTIITSLGTVMLPRIAACFANKEKEKINIYMERSFNFMFLLSFPMIFGIIAVSSDFVPLFFGYGYEKVIPIMSALAVIILFIGISGITGTQYLLTTKKQNQYTISVVVGAIVNFILNSILIKKYLSFGAAIATIIAELCVTLVQLHYVNKTLDLKKIFSLMFNYLLASFIMFCVCRHITLALTKSILSFAIEVSTGVIIYIGILFILKDKFLMYLIKSFKRSMHEKLL